ncbi:alpha/beta-Hydrolases superfamily protein [Euphorbia peplus]|nr:alpha/beta-Hydrolases superfamily protein [Euphorbia peplus]
MMNLLEISIWFLHGLLRLVGMKPQLVEIEAGTVMHYWLPSRTRSNKPALVFLHGFGVAGALTWPIQVLTLSRTYEVYVPDLIFFGNSTTDKLDRSLEFQAQCVAKSLKKLGVEKCIVVGSTYGGMVGFKMGEMYPDLVKSMVVSGSVLALTESLSSERMNKIGFSSWSGFFIPRTVTDLQKVSEISSYKMPWYANFVSQGLLKIMAVNRKETAELLEALIVKDTDFRIPEFSQEKIHLIWGENDRIFNLEIAQKVKEQLNGRGTLHIIKKAGHTVVLERPFAYNFLLKKILPSICED